MGRLWRISFSARRITFLARVLSSANDNSAGPYIAELSGRWRIVVIVKPASFRRNEIKRLPLLPVLQETEAIHLMAEIVLRVWVGSHVVRPRIAVDEQHTRARRHGQFLRADAARRQRKSVRIGRIRRGSRRGTATSARRGKQAKEDREEDHSLPLSGGPASIARRAPRPAAIDDATG